MLRQVSSRNQRGKGGFKMKNALHICLLVAICVWLLYQMKHSHDKKKAFDEHGPKASFKGDRRHLDTGKLGRKDLPHTTEVEPIGKGRIEEEEKRIRNDEVGDEEEGSDEDHEMDEQDQEGSETHEEHKKVQTKEIDGVEDREHDEKAREISFKGDDASSEVVHIIQEVEHEEASQEARERSFRADDASSAVAHVPQVSEHEPESENGGARRIDEKESGKTERKDGETPGSLVNGTLELIAAKMLDNGEGRNSTTHNNTFIKRDGTPAVQNVSSHNMTTGETKNPEGQQPIMRIASIVNNQTQTQTQTQKERQSTNTKSNEVDLLTNSTSPLKQQIYFQKNSTTVSVEWVDGHANLTAKVDPTNVTVSQNQTGAVRSGNEQVNLVKLQTQRDVKPNWEKGVIEQKPDKTAILEESEMVHKTSSGTDGFGNALHLESEKNRDENGAVLNAPGIQNRVQSGKQEAMTA
ncbi:acidic leucine-rich nuclear phosphoprotein 32-related protein-like [Canna indica]|uniref:Acidic leucine-rich nuclear phosphoprotein 32-related protein-like n=1 Tax=Canna indica TaxID=4628 RepID=A0AAQ3JTE3_9LILI|nr:acidic leucine-rich nuclear phosphoprotein 32-related protein-like [Canna indica]